MKTHSTKILTAAASLLLALSVSSLSAATAPSNGQAPATPDPTAAKKIPQTQLPITELVENIRLELNDRLARLGLQSWNREQVSVYKVRYPFVVAVWHGTEALPGTTADGRDRRLLSTVELYADYDGRRMALLAQVTDNEGNPMPDQQADLEKLVNAIANVEQMTFTREHPGVAVDEKMDRNLQIQPLANELPEM